MDNLSDKELLDALCDEAYADGSVAAHMGLRTELLRRLKELRREVQQLKQREADRLFWRNPMV